jgi:hypothetical protein
MTACRIAVGLVLGLAACGGGGAGDEPDAAPPAPDAAPDPSDELFRPDHVYDVRITMAAADWEQMRNQPETIGLPHVTCDEQPTEEPYSTFHADLSVDGVAYADVGIRKKGGFGSISTERPGMKVDVHEYVAEQRIFGLKHLTLNNNHQDPARIKQCLGFGLFAAAGLPAPRCSFAHVTVNGEDLGVYSNVETIKDNFLRRNFGDDSGNLYESGGDFVAGGVGSFQPKTNSSAPDCSDLDPVVDALAAPDGEIATRVGAVVDLPEFTRYWAMEVLADHWDGYANNRNNFYFYHDPSSGQMKFIPWGVDALFEGRPRTTRPYSVFACGSMPWKLYSVPETRAQYLAALRDVLATVWDETAILAEIARMQALIQPFETADLADRIQPVRDFVSARGARLEAELGGSDPVWPYPAGEDSCLIRIGTITASFSTTWDSLSTLGGSGSTSGTVSGVNVASSTLYAGAGLDNEGKVALQLLSLLPDGRYAVVFVIVHDPADFVTGTQAIDLGTVAAFMMFYDPATDSAGGGGLMLPGSMTLTGAAMTTGGTVAGSVTGEVREL